MLKQLPDQRAVILGQYIIENKSTVRATAKKFGISKSTVHMDVQKENVLKCLNTAFLPSSALRQRTVFYQNCLNPLNCTLLIITSTVP